MTSPPGGSNESLETRLGVLTERVTGDERAMVLQAKEYERRLAELNHTHAKQVEDQGTYLNKGTFEATLAGWASWREGVERRLTLIEGRGAGSNSARTLFFQLLPLLGYLLALIALLWRR